MQCILIEHPLNDSEYSNVGETMKIHVSLMKLVTWHAGAPVIVSSAEQTARHGDTATVECAVYATPPPFHISWRRHLQHINFELGHRFTTQYFIYSENCVRRSLISAVKVILYWKWMQIEDSSVACDKATQIFDGLLRILSVWLFAWGACSFDTGVLKWRFS